MIKKMRCKVCLFCIGGSLYTILEIFWRGFTHWTMFFVGGACFIIIGQIQTLCQKGIIERCAFCSLAITAVEFVSGCIINLWLKMNVWDYSGMWLNIKGQVCLLYSILWGGLSWLAVPVYQRCVAHLTGNEKKLKKTELFPKKEVSTN